MTKGTEIEVLQPGTKEWGVELKSTQKRYPGLEIPFGLTGSGTDNAETAAEIEQRLTSARTLEELYQASDAPDKFENHVGQVFVIRDFHWMPSTKGDGIWPYAVADCVDADGQPTTMSMGGRKVVLTLAICKRDGLLPAAFRLTSDVTAAGNDVYGLVRP